MLTDPRLRSQVDAISSERRDLPICWMRLLTKVNALRELQTAGGEELSALLPSVLDKAFKGEL